MKDKNRRAGADDAVHVLFKMAEPGADLRNQAARIQNAVDTKSVHQGIAHEIDVVKDLTIAFLTAFNLFNAFVNRLLHFGGGCVGLSFFNCLIDLRLRLVNGLFIKLFNDRNTVLRITGSLFSRNGNGYHGTKRIYDNYCRSDKHKYDFFQLIFLRTAVELYFNMNTSISYSIVYT